MENQNEFLNALFTEGKNEAIQKYNNGNYKEAALIFSDLLKSEMNTIDSSILLCNRAACYIKMENYEDSLKDMIETVRLKPDWGKAWGRLGASLYGLGRFDKAITAYKKANELEPSSIYENMIIFIEKFGSCKATISDNIIKEMLSNDKLISKIEDENFQKLFFTNPMQLLQDKELVDMVKQYLH
jgi:tetratricopeptide (TPR) repeat protein